uniref:Methyltransferase type 11 domain-containing protein n=1 Tax=Amorphochlora amoebiformis TaxID=1561963 RepID=A0A6T6Z054_9EUKA|mmetsp:Transcript_7795/g.12114  ORF Transcript_7795/g.12114 Transcript_7795/m.12114 type:complete len:196 (+) Transcript_7795:223-810(+)
MQIPLPNLQKPSSTPPKGTFEWLAPYAEWGSSFERFLAAGLLDSSGKSTLPENWREDASILNVGCGYSCVHRRLLDAGFRHIVNSDINESALKHMSTQTDSKPPPIPKPIHSNPPPKEQNNPTKRVPKPSLKPTRRDFTSNLTRTCGSPLIRPLKSLESFSRLDDGEGKASRLGVGMRGGTVGQDREEGKRIRKG